eukprot:CAMPEP_0172450634 /NCGR_PEP_ID=MMETSP1065-20121228/8898_1 /TAXON_ID=265537 /ORGANISM="Amphiprora paludosa, Strain CCMP125" /LENGTH=739 /DNA_ID=CAMNT_0013202431 /DNA_START=169 /DNA_END=2388 /DNA_ORIENTATION=+
MASRQEPIAAAAAAAAATTRWRRRRDSVAGKPGATRGFLFFLSLAVMSLVPHDHSMSTLTVQAFYFSNVAGTRQQRWHLLDEPTTRIQRFGTTLEDEEYDNGPQVVDKNLPSKLDYGTLTGPSLRNNATDHEDGWGDDFNGKHDDDDDYDDDDDTEPILEDGSNGDDSTAALQHQVESLQKQLEQQQQMVEKLVQSLQNNVPIAAVPQSTVGMEEEELVEPNFQNHQGNLFTSPTPTGGTRQPAPVVPLKAMLFVDGTWLYYSLFGREDRCPIQKKFGLGWPQRYDVDYSVLPKVICKNLNDLGWSSMDTSRPIDIVRASVFTSYKADTPSTSLRYRMFEEMKEANYDVNQMETVGRGEKCVDIQLAVEMLHYATIPNAYDIAILFTGDKDFLPALVRTRQKGRKVALVSMRSSCNQALRDANGIKDYDVIWFEDHLDDILVPKPVAEQTLEEKVSVFLVAKVLRDFIKNSGFEMVSSRDVGRYLQCLNVGTETLLHVVRTHYGGIGSFIGICKGIFGNDSTDPTKGFQVFILPGAEHSLIELARKTSLTPNEKKFFESYDTSMLRDRRTAYYYTMGVSEDSASVTTDGEPEIDYSSYTVTQLKEICRERDIATTGLKAELVERLKEDAKQLRASFWKHTIGARQETSEPIEVAAHVESHLQNVVKEYLLASRGTASSRDIGRYLAANKSSNDRFTALQELKREYGGLLKFVQNYPDLFESGGDSGEAVSFMVSLKPGN